MKAGVSTFARPPLEPPVSPTPLGATPPPQPFPGLSVEAQLLRAQVLTPEQVSEAMRIEAQTGRPIADVVVERGWTTRAEVDEALAAPSQRSEPGEPERPAVEHEQEDAPPVEVRVLVRLLSGTELEAGVYTDAEEARHRARALVEQLGDVDTWPFVAGKPLDAVDVATIYLAKS
jgi:hypothetical protein